MGVIWPSIAAALPAVGAPVTPEARALSIRPSSARVLRISFTARCSRLFFFQAEAGIRDHCVTGVQTCALPILKRLVLCAGRTIQASLRQISGADSPGQLGRASYRERVYISVVDGALTKKK